jgi:hypothetical protein
MLTRSKLVMMQMAKLHFVSVLAALALVAGVPVAASAKACDSLPRSALKERKCNPQAECLASLPKDGKASATRQKECRRLPTSGVCHGPDQYDPQAECRTSSRKK